MSQLRKTPQPTNNRPPPANKSSEDGSGTATVPKAKLSITLNDGAARLTRPIRSVVDTTPKKFGPTLPEIVDVPNKSLLGLNSEIAMFPANGPGKASKPTADSPAVNVISKVAEPLCGPKTLLELPSPAKNVVPRTASCVLAAPEALYGNAN